MATTPRHWFWLGLAAVPLLGAMAWLVIQLVGPSLLDFPEIAALARAGRFDRVEAELTRRLTAEPDDAQARLLLAQVSLDRPDRKPEVALEHLDGLRPADPKAAAQVEFLKGKAHYQRARYDLAEPCWAEALRLHPTVAEAGWALLDLLYTEGRVREAHDLGMRLHQVEPDPRDRVRYLLELCLIDVDKVAPGFQLERFQPIVRDQPDNLPLRLTTGLALVRESRMEEGLALLRETVNRHPESPEAWDALLIGLDDASRPEELAEELARLPRPLAADPRFARHAGLAAQSARDWPAAAEAYRRALEFEPYNGVVLYRLSRSLHSAGEAAESARVDERLKRFQTASKQMRGVVEEAQKVASLGVTPQPTLYLRLAELSERTGRVDVALAWHQLVLRDNPREQASLAALERLK